MKKVKEFLKKTALGRLLIKVIISIKSNLRNFPKDEI